MGKQHVPPVNAFSETAALWHLLEGRRGDAWRIIEDMTPFERWTLYRSLGELREALVRQDWNSQSETRTS